ncbi:uncharacterized protein CANTADRAFT_19961 [Suhomyces tanzawaensis NRRL Y-17324]|uniref:Uncharacterized protein n=1 Tax=Suhomyces tanzawaensis NRRL Y-17324 TaxID=984487 RepID=A0A1E4SSL2_9ASCO|nr:uncharacterized protein CANTADRAFT_19961 [Suhomyces tanzawaensis NRRL Y-17324]ODV82407.1 hypothetical protein CANTADRAFT_19961 [Suhomyces tanzawaensis NRRL Y-17324]
MSIPNHIPENHPQKHFPSSTPPPNHLFMDMTPQMAHTYFQSPSSDVSPVIAQPAHFFLAPGSATNSSFQFANTPIMPETGVFVGTNFSPMAPKPAHHTVSQSQNKYHHDTSSSFYSQPVFPNASDASLDAPDRSMGLGVFTESSPAPSTKFVDQRAQFSFEDPQKPPQPFHQPAEVHTDPSSIEPRSTSNDFDSPTTIEVSSPRSSNHASNGDGDITADDILNGDPFESMDLAYQKRISDDIVSSFVDFDLAGDKSSEELEPEEFQMAKFSTLLGPLDPINEDSNVTRSTPSLKKQASNSKINKKTLKKSSSFSGQTFAIPLVNNLARDSKRVKPPLISFRECSQRFSISSLNKYSFVYENAGNDDEKVPKLQKSQSSVSIRQLEQSHRLHQHYQYDNRGTHANGDSSPRVLRNMKAGMVEFQVNLDNSKGSN